MNQDLVTIQRYAVHVIRKEDAQALAINYASNLFIYIQNHALKNKLTYTMEQMNNWIDPTVRQLRSYTMHVLHNFQGFNTNTTAFCLGRCSLHLLLLKSSMVWVKFFVCSRRPKTQELFNCDVFVDYLFHLCIINSHHHATLIVLICYNYLNFLKQNLKVFHSFSLAHSFCLLLLQCHMLVPSTMYSFWNRNVQTLPSSFI